MWRVCKTLFVAVITLLFALVVLGVDPADAAQRKTSRGHKTTSEEQAREQSVTRGFTLLSDHCGRCHAVGGEASAHTQAPPFRELGKRYPIDSLEEALAEGLQSGHPDMPEFTFEPEDVGAIIAYLKSIQAPSPSQPQPESQGTPQARP